MTDQWTPPGFDPAEYGVLYEGIPAWLAGPLIGWMKKIEFILTSGAGVSTVDLARKMDTRMRATKTLASAVAGSSITTQAFRRDVDFTLTVIDFFLWHLTPPDPRAEGLIAILDDAGSEWTASSASGRFRLVKRVPQAVVAAVERATSTGSDAAGLLVEAWQATFGMPPNPEESYEKSIKAVEAAGAHIVEPKNSRATLGTMTAAMKSQGDWALPLTDKAGLHFIETVPSLADSLWRGQPSRHGNNGYRAPTQEEAESALFAAVALVQWFESGAIARR